MNYKWKQRPGKRTCKDSNNLNNTIDTMRNWRTKGTPGSESMACKGKCDCMLVPTKEEKAISIMLSGQRNKKMTSNIGGIVQKEKKPRAETLEAIRPDGARIGSRMLKKGVRTL